jgi:heme o synthase
MALVVTARSPAQAQSGFAPQSRLSRLQVGLRWLSIGAAVWYGLGLVTDSLRRSVSPTDLGLLADQMPPAPSTDLLNLATKGVSPGEVLDLAAMVVSAGGVGLALTVCIVAWLARREAVGLLVAATLAPIFVALRVVSTGLLVTLELPTLATVADVGFGLLVLGCLVWVASTSLAGGGAEAGVFFESESAASGLFRRVVDVTAFVVFAAGLTGVTVQAVGASWACQASFPDCNGLGALPFGRDPLADIQLYHRLLSYATLSLVLWLAVEAFRTQRGLPSGSRASLVLLGSTVAQGAIGAASVWSANPPQMQALHMAGAAATWSAAVVLMVVAHGPALTPAFSHRERANGAQLPLPLGEGGGEGLSSARIVSAYIQLTKPRVMSLLLATTAAAMVIAARGMPPLSVVVWTLIGGALMSGGAGAINHYVDRDIDPLMGRTAWRPIPSGVISPRRALWFGITLAVLASVVFVAFVNLIACVLSIAGLLGYVFIYTLWLKRSTPSNIVIGGAAGAIPPLVGWAAVTNEISSLTAWYLFAIIFFWTPPHFWALSLLIRKHYERAGVPMLPVVRGEDETRRQIVLYSVLLVVLTLVLSPFGMMGAIYFGAAVVLGALFIRGALRLWRQATPQAARSLYLYSILYLFALFAAMAVDRVVASS